MTLHPRFKPRKTEEPPAEHGVLYADISRISGDRYNGVYRVQLPVNGNFGTNDLEIYARDNLGNESYTTFENQLEIVSG